MNIGARDMTAGTTGHVEASFTWQGGAQPGWVVEGATVTDAVNRPYLLQIELQADRPDADPVPLLGQSAELHVRRGDSEPAVYPGIVSSVRAAGRSQLGVRAEVTLEPALAALRHGRDTRIFQDLTVPEVLEQVLGAELGAYGRAVGLELRSSYAPREYTVQYGESHFDFVHRLMEEEGIFYYFEPDGPVERMVLLDSPAQHPRLDPAVLRFADVEGDASTHEQEYVRSFEEVVAIGGTSVATRHFDWTHPSVLVEASGQSAGGAVSRESYEHDEQVTLHGFAGAYTANDASHQARVRAEQQARDQRVFEGHGTATGLRAGLRFDLVGTPDGLDGSYVVVEVRHLVLGHVTGSHRADAVGNYVNELRAVDADTAWRPVRTRRRPRIRGIQTAIVTGPPGEEIHVDEHGRIKVHFHWDRQGGFDERSSCWIRVAQTAAGAGFGAWVLPRVGWEVVVDFVDGDPDRPLVTGCVYNGDHPLPYPLPEKKTLTLMKTNSYPGGGGFNELRFDDAKGEEEIWLHGQKDWNTVILNDLTRQVGHDEQQHVGNDRTRTVIRDETLGVGANRIRTVGVNESVTVGADRVHAVGANETISVGADRHRSVGANETVIVTDNRTAAVGADERIEVGANRHRNVGGDDFLQVGGDRQAMVVGNQSVQIGGNESYRIGSNADRKVDANANEKVSKMRQRKVGLLEMVNVGIAQMVNVSAARIVSAGMVHMINAGMIMKLKAGKKMELACGKSKITLTPEGVKVEGPQIEITAKGDVQLQGEVIHLN